MTCPVGTVVDEDEISSVAYERFIRDHVVPGTYWRWHNANDSPSGLTLRVTGTSAAGITYDLIEGHDATEVYRDEFRAHERFGPDPGWTLTKLDESDWLLLLLGCA